MINATKTRAKAAREARLRAALRENLKRRKAQARGRAQDEPAPQEAESPESTATSDKPER
jgi:Arc/MetJ-type ribon-helix-helix transcriptional regulator